MLREKVPVSSPQQRVIRVFVSSTFRDMQAERNELVKRIFPQLRKLCESRGVTWGEVDLRWGITDEQKAEGKVLPICLEAIRRCRPYFIRLLGERYGWVPEEVPPAVIKQEPWFAELRGHSVTELEILHGVLSTAEEQARSQRDLLVHAALAGIGVIILLSIVMQNYRNLLLVLANLPFALVGGVLVALATGGNLSLGSLVGFVTLFGITIRNSIMLISHYEHLIQIEGLEWNWNTAVRGASERLSPILMTALVTALGLLPPGDW